MNKIGKKVLVKRGLFVGYEGVISGIFQYKGNDVYVIDVCRGKNITEKFTTTVSESEFEYIQ
jgi:Ni2+-binding GTPase involved in maturation of urease and hydrogenase